jgi:urease accessory protein
MRCAMLRVLAATLMLAPATAFAHTGLDHAHGFAQGLAHPLGGFDHILAMVAVGALGWQLGGRAVWLLPATFVSLMALGGLFGLAGGQLPAVELAIAASVLVFGSMLALEMRAPVLVVAALAGLFAVFHGYAHGSEMPFEVSVATYAAGFVLATAFLHLVGIALGSLNAHLAQAGRVAFRLGGGATALAGLALLANAL